MKDKEWLKKELMGLKCSINGIGKARLGEVFELVDQLDEPEVLSQQWIDENIVYADVKGNTEAFLNESSVRNLLVPKQDKPIIPQFVADYIEKWGHEGLTIYEWFSFGNNDVDEDVNKWLYNNTIGENTRREYLLIDAIRYGYEVEKEKKYYVAFEDINLLYVTRIEVYGENGKLYYNSESSTENAMKFTDKEKASSLAYFLGAIVVEVQE